MYKSRINHEVLELLTKKISLSHLSRFKRLLKNGPKEMYPRLINPILHFQKKTKEINIKTFWGENMKVLLPDFYSSLLYKYGFVEEQVISYILYNLKPEGTFIDIGTHYGFFTLLAREVVGEKGKIHSFEPTPKTYNILKQNVNKYSNIYTNNCLVWAKSQNLMFNDYGPGYSEINSVFNPRTDAATLKKLKVNTFEVKAVSIDDYVKKENLHPQFIKIDAESAEMEILKGMSNVLENQSPCLALELGDFDIENVPSSKSIIDFLTKFGYKPYEYNNGKIIEHKIRDYYSYDVLLFRKEIL